MYVGGCAWVFLFYFFVYNARRLFGKTVLWSSPTTSVYQNLVPIFNIMGRFKNLRHVNRVKSFPKWQRYLGVLWFWILFYINRDIFQLIFFDVRKVWLKPEYWSISQSCFYDFNTRSNINDFNFDMRMEQYILTFTALVFLKYAHDFHFNRGNVFQILGHHLKILNYHFTFEWPIINVPL